MKKLTRRVLNLFVGLCTMPANAALRMMPASWQTKFKEELFKSLYRKNEYGLISFCPKSTESMQVKTTDRDFGDTAVILQGPVILQDHFTLNTVKMYRQFYKNVSVIVSTWVDAPQEEVSALREAGAIVLLNAYPAENFVGNLNLQLTTALAGVKKAKEMRGVRYVCKTRSDQRYYNPCALSLLIGRHQPGKITLLGAISNSYCKWPFFICDFFSFGEVSELEELYSCDLTTTAEANARKKAEQEIDFDGLLEEVWQAERDLKRKLPPLIEEISPALYVPEVKIAYRYFARKADVTGYKTVQEAYEDFLRRFVIIVDADQLGFYWLKRRDQASMPTYFQRYGKLDMARWMAMQNE